MELRTAIQSLLTLEDDSKNRGSGRTHRILERLLDTVLNNPDKDNREYVHIAHDAGFSQDCRKKFCSMARGATKGADIWELQVVLEATRNRVLLGNRTVYFYPSSHQIVGRSYAGIYEDHFVLQGRLQALLDTYLGQTYG